MVRVEPGDYALVRVDGVELEAKIQSKDGNTYHVYTKNRTRICIGKKEIIKRIRKKTKPMGNSAKFFEEI